MQEEPEISSWGRIGVGFTGGLLVVANKIISQGVSALHIVFKNLAHDEDALFEFAGYAVVALAIILITAAVAWAVSERSRLKLMAIAVSGPALVGTWTVPENLSRQNLSFIAPAFAQESRSSSATESFWRGVRLFFNGAPEAQRYRVVVASAKTPEEAASIMNELHTQIPSIQAAVADRAPGNAYFAVLASDFVSYDEANAILQQVRKTPLGADAYLSAEKTASSGSSR